jgi:phosphohistidine phosphatase SixA
MPESKLTIILIAVLVLASACTGKDNTCPVITDDPVRLQHLLDLWSSERALMVLRHTTKCNDEEPNCVDGNERLTDAGRVEAQAIGTGVHTLLGRNYSAFHSPLDRTHDTAMLAFGKSTESQDISPTCKPTFDSYIRKYTADGNTILVTHSSCIDALKDEGGDRLLGLKSGDDENFGIAALFETQPLRVIGCMRPADWDSLSGSAPTVR